jgi:hypothetical protein
VNIAMTYAHSHEAVTTYTVFLESDESPTSTRVLPNKRTCPNASEAHPVLLRYEQRRRPEVDDIW